MATFSLHCDVCGHSESVRELNRSLIGKACPRCTADMLSEADFRVAKRMLVALPLLRLMGLARDQLGAAVTIQDGRLS